MLRLSSREDAAGSVIAAKASDAYSARLTDYFFGGEEMKATKTAWRALLLLCLSIVHPTVGAENQVVELNDGSTLSGRVVSLQDGVYTIESGTLGRLQVGSLEAKFLQARHTCSPHRSSKVDAWQCPVSLCRYNVRLPHMRWLLKPDPVRSPRNHVFALLPQIVSGGIQDHVQLFR